MTEDPILEEAPVGELHGESGSTGKPTRGVTLPKAGPAPKGGGLDKSSSSLRVMRKQSPVE